MEEITASADSLYVALTQRSSRPSRSSYSYAAVAKRSRPFAQILGPSFRSSRVLSDRASMIKRQGGGPIPQETVRGGLRQFGIALRSTRDLGAQREPRSDWGRSRTCDLG